MFVNGVDQATDTQVWVLPDGTTAAAQPAGLEDCKEEYFGRRCVKWTTLAIGVDNTGTRFQWNSTIELTNNDGSTTTFVQTPTG